MFSSFCIEIKWWCTHSRKIPVRARTCCWFPSLRWGSCGAVPLQFLCRVRKKLYSFGEDQGRLPAGLPGGKEHQTLRGSPCFFFLKGMMEFPVFWVMKKNTVEFWTCNLQFGFSMPKQYLCRIDCHGCHVQTYNLENLVLLSEQFDFISCHEISADRYASHK